MRNITSYITEKLVISKDTMDGLSKKEKEVISLVKKFIDDNIKNLNNAKYDIYFEGNCVVVSFDYNSRPMESELKSAAYWLSSDLQRQDIQTNGYMITHENNCLYAHQIRVKIIF